MFGQHISFALDIVVLSASMCLAFSNLDIFPCVHNEIDSVMGLKTSFLLNQMGLYPAMRQSIVFVFISDVGVQVFGGRVHCTSVRE